MINFKWGIFLNVLIFMFFSIFLMTNLASPQAQPKVDVSVQVRSGVPNPGWVINNPNDIAQLQALINGLPSAAPVQQPPFGAFRLDSNESISGFPQTVLVFNGVMEISKADGTTQFFQDAKGLSAFLVSKATLKCPLGQGFWKNHPSAWPVTSLILGSQTYTQTQLLTILDTAVGTGNNADASLILADQLIAAKLSIVNGSIPIPISTTIGAADALLKGFADTLPYKVKPSSTTGQAMVNNANTLDNFNNGQLTPSCVP